MARNRKLNTIFFYIFKFFVFAFAYFYTYEKLKNISISSVSYSSNFVVIIITEFFLMLINWGFEAKKWQNLVEIFQKLTIKAAFKQILIGLSIGFFTPNRVGELPARASFLPKGKKMKGAAAATIGSFAQLSTTFIFGFIGLIFYRKIFFPSKYFWYFFLFLCFISFFLLIIYFFRNKFLYVFEKLGVKGSYRKYLLFLKNYKRCNKCNILIYSVLRYVIFSFQFYLLLKLFKINISFSESISPIFVYFLIITIIPSFFLADIGIRGSVSIYIFGNFSANHYGIFLSSVILWLINIFIPASIGYILLLRTKTEAYTTGIE